MATSILTSYDPEIPISFTEEDCLEFACSRGEILKFHMKAGYFYWWETGAQGEIRLRCACKQFMVKHHTSKCIHSSTEYEMTETCWLSSWFALGDKWHNHPPPSRASVELNLFKWQVNLRMVKSGNAKLISHVIDDMYPSWPFPLSLSKWQLRKLIYTAGSCKFLDQGCIDSMMAFLMTSPDYWGPPVEPDTQKDSNSETQQCCGKIIAASVKRNGVAASRRPRKKIRPSVDNDSDYDTEPLPEKSTQSGRKAVDEPIASGSRDSIPLPKRPTVILPTQPKRSIVTPLPQPKRSIVTPLPQSKRSIVTPLPQSKRSTPDMPTPIHCESRIENTPVKPGSIKGVLKGPLSRRRTIEEISLDPPEVRDPIRKVRFAEILVKRSQMIVNQSGMNLYTIPLDKIAISRSNVERYVFGKADGVREHRTVLVLGAIGTGQAKFINSILNYVFHVKNEDNFRFHVAEEKEFGQTNCITVYVIHHSPGFQIPFSLTIIHTPSYVDVGDGKLFRHRKLTRLFREFFEEEHGIENLDMVCNLLLKDGANNSFLSIFGYDVEENVHCFLPKDNSFPSVDFIQRFFSMLVSMKPKSLTLTKEVLNVMNRLEKTMDAFFPLVRSGSSKLDELKNARQVISTCQSQTELNKQIENKFTLYTAARKYNTEMLWKTVCSGGHELVDLLKTDFNGIVKAVLEHYKIASSSIQQLKRISRGNPFLTQELYDLLFEVEQKLKRFGHAENL